MYLLLFLCVGAALVPKTILPVIPSNQAMGVYNAIQNAPTDKVAILGCEWSASTQGENGAQTRAVLHHLMRRHIPLALLGFEQQGPENVRKIIEDLSPRYGYVYGRDWVNFGFRPAGASKATLKAMVRDVPGALLHDNSNSPLTDTAKLPLMAHLHTIDDIGLIVEITPSSTYEDWVAFVQGVKGTPMVFCPTAVMAPEAYQYLDSGQMAGMLTGLKGAIEYEGLVKEPGRASHQALALSVSHIVIIVLIVLGNLGYLAHRRQETGA